MRQCFGILVASLLALGAHAGVRPLGSKTAAAAQSAALFVGVRDFDDRKITAVPYAVDDAVDLAYELTIGQSRPLVPPDRVALALSPGNPVKPESRRRLRELVAAGAKQYSAERQQVLRLLAQQSRLVGMDGILIVHIATHGVSTGGLQHLLARGSDFDDLQTMIATSTISQIVSDHDVARALILIDACRENLRRDRRAGEPDARSKAAFIRVLTGVEGQVMISGAPRGGYAYDDDARRNGVFTATLIDGLRCAARKDAHGFVTVDGLYDYVSREVLRWVRQNRNKRARMATQLSCEGETKKMPLSICGLGRAASNE